MNETAKPMIDMENLKKAAKGSARFVGGVWEVAKDRELTLGDMPHGIDILMGAADLAGVNWADIPDDFNELNEAQHAEIATTFSENFDISDDSAERNIEAIASNGLRIVNAVCGILDDIKEVAGMAGKKDI